MTPKKRINLGISEIAAAWHINRDVYGGGGRAAGPLEFQPAALLLTAPLQFGSRPARAAPSRAAGYERRLRARRPVL